MARRISQKRNTKTYEQPGLSEDEVKEIREAFDLFDTDGSGSIDRKELNAAMQSLGFEGMSQKSGEMNEEDHGTIDFENFLDMLTTNMVSNTIKLTMVEMVFD